MRKRVKLIAGIAAIIIIIACCCTCLYACSFDYDKLASQNLNYLADTFSLLMLGNDAFSWNVFALNPEKSFGYEQSGESAWYSYSSATEKAMRDLKNVFKLFNDELEKINGDRLHGKDLVTYRSFKNVLTSQLDRYSSPYALDFQLIDGDYINAQGGYVADFTSAVENYAFRNENDVKNLLAITRSTKEAFESYLNFATDRANAGYPLYDFTLSEMKAYLDEITAQGKEYYLYPFIHNKINAAEFLTDAQKSVYISDYDAALSDSFAEGVKKLSAGLDAFMGRVPQTDKSYLASYGEIGKAYYKWLLKNKTGVYEPLANITTVEKLFDFLSQAAEEYESYANEVLNSVEALKDVSPETYDDFYAYVDGDKKLMGLTEPQEMLDYLKTASKEIVPDLESEPTITFKNMDDTAGKRTNTVAYYLLSPIDAIGAPESITINSYYCQNYPQEDLLSVIAHEGYPGHLYAHVRQKEMGISLLSAIANNVTSYSEGWAVYTQIAIMRVIAKNSQSQAEKLYCEYYENNLISSYANFVLMDMQINYFGLTVAQYVELGFDEERARNSIESLMEIPTLYVSYGLGGVYMMTVHDFAKTQLGDDYNEVEFNGVLLSEGSNPTLVRGLELTLGYITSKKPEFAGGFFNILN